VSSSLKRRSNNIYATLIIFAGVLLASAVSITTAPTVDEGKHIINGAYYLDHGDCCRRDEAPFAALHALPLIFDDLIMNQRGNVEGGIDFYLRNRAKAFRIKVLSRLFNVGAFFIILMILWYWATTIFPPGIALFTLVLGAFSPTLLAHASVATEDLFLTAMAFASFYQLFRHLSVPTTGNFILLCVLLSLTLATKVSALFPFIGIFIVFIIAEFQSLKTSRFSPAALCQQLSRIILLGLVPVILLNAAYLFKGTFDTLRKTKLKSPTMVKMQMSWIGAVPLPLPRGYIRAMDSIQAEKVTRPSKSPAYMLGETYTDSRLGYFPFAFLVKTSTVLLILLVPALYQFFRRSTPPWLGWCLFFFPLFFLVLTMLLNPFNSGQRYLLPVYPFLILGAGFAFFHSLSKAFRLLLPIYAGVTLFNFPNYVAFYNVSSLVVKKEYLLTDTNLDWGQMNYLIEKDAQRHGKKVCNRAIGVVLLDASIKSQTNLRYPEKCVYYLSKTLKYFPRTEKYFELFGEPDYELGQVIEVYHIDSEEDINIDFVNEWLISTPFPRPNELRDVKAHLYRERQLSYLTVRAEMGVVNLNAVFPDANLDDTCVIAKSSQEAVGTLLLTVNDEIVLYDEQGIYGSGQGSRRPVFYEFTVDVPQSRHLRAVVCNRQGKFDFAVGYR